MSKRQEKKNRTFDSKLFNKPFGDYQILLFSKLQIFRVVLRNLDRSSPKKPKKKEASQLPLRCLLERWKWRCGVAMILGLSKNERKSLWCPQMKITLFLFFLFFGCTFFHSSLLIVMIHGSSSPVIKMEATAFRWWKMEAVRWS